MSWVSRGVLCDCMIPCIFFIVIRILNYQSSFPFIVFVFRSVFLVCMSLHGSGFNHTSCPLPAASEHRVHDQLSVLQTP